MLWLPTPRRLCASAVRTLLFLRDAALHAGRGARIFAFDLARASRRRPPSDSLPRATGQDATTRRAPCLLARTWSKRQGRIPRRRDNAVAGRDFHPTNTARRARAARSDVSSGNRETTARRANSLYAARSRRPCRIRLAARPKAARSQAGQTRGRMRGCGGGEGAVIAMPAPASHRSKRRPKAVRPLAAGAHIIAGQRRQIERRAGNASTRRADRRSIVWHLLRRGDHRLIAERSRRTRRIRVTAQDRIHQSVFRDSTQAAARSPAPSGAACGGGAAPPLEPNCCRRYSVSSCMRLSCISSC